MTGAEALTAIRQHAHWPAWRRAIGILFIAAVLALIARKLGTIDWDAVLEALRGFNARTLLPAAGFVALSGLLYSQFDVLGCRYAGHPLPLRRVMAISYVSYTLSLNLGATLGGAGVRYRLYSRAGLSAPQIWSLFVVVVTTNWLGYAVLAGAILAGELVVLPLEWGIPAALTRVLGMLMLAIPAAYLAACALWHGRHRTVRDHDIYVPTVRFAALQCALSAAHWMSMGAILYALLHTHATYFTVLGVLLASGLAGVVVRIPGGLGVIETVFLTMLGDQVPHGLLLAALIAYRALYYLIPLMIGAVSYFVLEARGKRHGGDEVR
ncbi:lysylphosphatidylglycerol synthase domain-containing protein [Cupriavidus nantongensis]|uniref:O-acetylhomoserine sulfhydrylase n=1 Tax=Cupriavidus nantongensis TaxID=1796606 RepID=A0A142JUU0_9BURK|nr:lysylphosphatidylglycerol synthase domain-containing protein [Cupriavidus nantongensis]AMR81852.1 O-acetylhomoserine sulfhydrylase [Cupriavidus nantongensis]